MMPVLMLVPTALMASEIPAIRRIVPMILAAIVVLVTVELIRRRKLREEYAMVWLGASAVLAVLAVLPEITIWLQRVLNIQYLTIIVMACFLFLGLILMHMAVVLSRHTEHIRQLAERMAILQEKLRRSHPSTERGEGQNDQCSQRPPQADTAPADEDRSGDGRNV